MKYHCDRNIEWNIPGGPRVTAHMQVKCKQGETDTKGPGAHASVQPAVIKETITMTTKNIERP